MQTEIAFYAMSDLVPGVLDVAGLASEADEVRRTASSAGEVAALLRRVRKEASGAWAPVVRDVCFWAEVVVWAAWRGDKAFEEYRSRLYRAIDDGYARISGPEALH